MKEQPHYTNLLTNDFFEENYVNKKMSYPKIREMLLGKGYNIHVGTLQKYAKKFNIGRDWTKARINWEKEALDYDKKYIQKDMIEFIDGFLLGDGGISYNLKSKNSYTARFDCGVEYEEFCKYLMIPFSILDVTIKKNKANNMKQGFIFSGRTRQHPDIYEQYLRWYPMNTEGKRVKQPPEDVQITKESVLRWYLGDGSVVVKENTIMLRLSTDGFSKQKVEMLVFKMRDINIKCHRTNENRIMVEDRGIPAFFDLIGQKSPIKCYDYKFNRVPFWRFKSKRMKDVAKELNIDYGRLSHFVKIGKINCFRLAEKARPRFFPEHIEECKKLIKEGQL